jgi:glycosyltransferase involved in cell wall biosynthesis
MLKAETVPRFLCISGMRQFVRAAAKVRQRSAEIGAIVRAIPRLRAAQSARGPGAPVRLRFVYHDLGAPTRYRVRHQIEQAQLAGLLVQEAALDGPCDLYDLRCCDLLYFYRLALAPPTLALCLAARLRHLPIIFDADDLVWDQRERWYNQLDQHYSPDRVARLLWATRRTRALMRFADALVFSTPYLARLAARSFDQPSYVNPNALSQAMLDSAAAAYAQRARYPRGAGIVIGYFCGQPHIHDEDLASIAPALCAVLDRHPHVRLRIYGEVRLTGTLACQGYAARIEQRPAVDWRELPQQIAQVDINIAPLIDNPQRRAKSAIKYLEAALVGVPTIASRLDPYQNDIADGATGLLAATNDEWAQCFTRLVEGSALRQRLGQAARAHALAQHTTAVRAANFAAIVAQVAT